MHKLTIQVPVYQFKCLVIIDKDIEKRINSYIKRNKWKLDVLTDNEQVNGMAISPGTVDTYYIFYSIESLTPNIITHEVSHLVDYVFADKGMEGSETRAYITGYVNEKIFDYVIKNQILVNKWMLFNKII